MNRSPEVRVSGELIGHLRESSGVLAEVVRATVEQRPAGPAENALFLIEHTKSGPVGRYITWIGYFDIEQARSCHGGWEVVEPGRAVELELKWVPFGDGSIELPNHSSSTT